MKLRPYQQEAYKAILEDIQLPEPALAVLPTASGKSHIIASVVAALNAPVLILQPSQELLEQNEEKLALLVPKRDIGIYSASFGKKEIKKFTFATIQSVYKIPGLFSHIKLVIIDEAHGLNPKEFETMYMEFLKGMGDPKVIGLTATAFRLAIGYVAHYDKVRKKVNLEAVTTLKMLTRMRHKKMKRNFWKRIVFNVSHKELLEQGYLSPLEYIDKPLLPYAEIPINKSHSDYDLEAYAKTIVGREATILRTIAEAQKRYKSILVFCSTTEQAKTLQKVMKRSELVLAETKRSQRSDIIGRFKSGKLQTIFNVGTLTTGFDHPALDCLILLRPTRSPVLYNQILGRLTRIARGKAVGTVIDLTGTCRNMGKIETFELYQTGKVWDVRSERHRSFHNKILFSRKI